MALEVTEVSVRFGGVSALSGVSLSAPAGRITGLIGPNGAGKTTLFDVITGMRKPQRGHVLLDGRDVSRLSSYRRARLGLGRTFQKLELFGTLTVRENISAAASMGRPVFRRPGGRRDADESTPDDSGAAEPIARVTERLLDYVSLGDVADRRADTVPTGTGRLVELARALAVNPTVLLLDEPASGQNVDETAGFAEVLRSLAADGLAVLLVEHDMELVMRICDHIYVLDFGDIIASGPPDAIRKDPMVQAAYLGEASTDDGHDGPAAPNPTSGAGVDR
jgi:branched-chain amino acid transport system ATP-binding protein